MCGDEGKQHSHCVFCRIRTSLSCDDGGEYEYSCSVEGLYFQSSALLKFANVSFVAHASPRTGHGTCTVPAQLLHSCAVRRRTSFKGPS